MTAGSRHIDADAAAPRPSGAVADTERDTMMHGYASHNAFPLG
jgi:hypothetical protein